MNLKKVVHVTVNEYNPDYRIMKQVHSLKKRYNISIIALNNKECTQKEFENEEGVGVHRLRIISRKFKRRIFLPLKYIEAFIRSLVLLVKQKPEVIHCHDFPALPVGFLGSLITGGKLIYDSHEFREDSNITSEYPWIINKVTTKVEHVLARKADQIITVSPGIASLLADRINCRTPKVILNAPYKLDANAVALYNIREEFKIPSDAIIFTYIGGILPTRGFDLILDAFMKLDNPKIHLLLIGSDKFPDWLISSLSGEIDETNIHFISAVHPIDVLPLAKQADIGVHAIRGESLSHQYCMPNKLFEYIQAGLTLLMTDLPELKKTINKHEVGATFIDGDAADLAMKMNELINNEKQLETYRLNSRKLAETLNWDLEEQKILQLYQALEKK